MINRTTFVKDVNGRVIVPGDLLVYHNDRPAVNTVIYTIRLISGNEATLETVTNESAPLITVSLDDLARGFEVLLCTSCRKKLQIRLVEITNVHDEQVLVSTPEYIRCNACKYRFLAERIAEHTHGEAP